MVTPVVVDVVVPTLPAVAWRHGLWLAILAVVLLAALPLTACGGGADDHEPDTQLPGPPDCRNHPERCA